MIDFESPIQESWRYRELFYFFAWRDIKVRYKQTILGVVWAIIQPLFTVLVFTLLFGRLAGMPSDGTPHPIFYLSALLPWIYVSTTVIASGNSLVGNAGLITKVYFPRVILPASAALGALLDFAIGSVLLVVLMLVYRVEIHWTLLLWPLLVVPMFVLTVGIGMIMAALNVKYRDVKHAMPFGIQLWLFLTPIIYPTSMVPERFRALLALNPLGGLIEVFRWTVVPSRAPDAMQVLASGTLIGALWVIGWLYFRSTEKAFADIV
jgi:homopolymeric O-antigen transport system permease protein